jgi:hypothetical protein
MPVFSDFFNGSLFAMRKDLKHLSLPLLGGTINSSLIREALRYPSPS